MAVSRWSTDDFFSDDATFRAWGLAFSNAIAAAGLVQTADTGQINWGTVTKPGTTNTSAGYEVWRFNDALQATAPVYIKVEYGTAGGAMGLGGLWYTVGQGTDGAGTINVTPTARYQITITNYAGNIGFGHVTGAANRLLVMLLAGTAGTSASYGGAFFSVERSHDAIGGDTGDGLIIMGYSQAGGVHQFYYSMASGPGIIEKSFGILLPSGGTGTTGSRIMLSPIFAQKSGVFVNPSMNILAYCDSSLAKDADISFTYYNATRRYCSVGVTNLRSASRNPRGTVVANFLIRNE